MADAWQAHELDILLGYFNSSATILSVCDRLERIGCHRTVDSVRNKLHQLRKEAGYAKPRELVEHTMRVGYLDIEATNLSSDFGIMLCWWIKVAGQNKYYHALITEKEIHNRTFDRRIVSELLDAFEHFDVLVTHYGSDRRFDLPYIRTRALMHDMGDKLRKAQDNRFIRDTWLIAKNKLRLSSNRLERLQNIFGCEASKTPLDPQTWINAMYGDPQALQYVNEHCKADVDVLEQVHQKLEPVERKTYVRM